MSDEILDDFRDVSGWARRIGSGAARARPTPARRQRAASRLRLQGRRRVRRSEALCAPDAGIVGDRCKSAARRRRTGWRSSSPIPPAATSGGGTATPSSSRHVGLLRIRSSEVSFAWGPAVAARSASSVRSRSRSPPGPAAPARYQWRACVSGSLAPRTTARARVERDTRSRRRTRSTVARNELAQCVGRDAVDHARLRPRVRVRRHRSRLGARRGGARLRRAARPTARWTTLVARQAEGERSVYLPGGGHSRHLRLHLLEAAEARCVRDPPWTSVLRVLAVTRRVLPRRRGGRASRSFSALAASRAVLLDCGRRRGRFERRDHERGGHARARSGLSVARTVPVRGRRAGHVGGRRARDRARARLPADSVLDVAASRSRFDHDGLRRRGSHRSRRACLVPRRERRDDAEARPPLHHAPAVPSDAAVAVVRRARWTRTRSGTVVARRRRRR